MPNYQHGKIYKIVGNGKTYVGSTIQTLTQRFSSHKNDYKNYLNGEVRLYTTSFECFNDTKCYIEILELYPCNSKKELHMCEAKWIKCLDCINNNIPGRTQKEYYQDNKIVRIAQSKERRIKNRDAVNAQKREYYAKNKELFNAKDKERYIKRKQLKE